MFWNKRVEEVKKKKIARKPYRDEHGVWRVEGCSKRFVREEHALKFLQGGQDDK